MFVRARPSLQEMDGGDSHGPPSGVKSSSHLEKADIDLAVEQCLKEAEKPADNADVTEIPAR